MNSETGRGSEFIRNRDLPKYIDDLAANELGIYVYALVDPRNQKIFYVGKGQGTRVLYHGLSPRAGEDSNLPARELKEKIIHDIRQVGKEPEWYVLRYNLADEDEAFNIEGSLIYALTRANQQELANRNLGMNSNERGGLTASEVMLLNAPQVDPERAYSCVFLFNIDKELPKRKGDVYLATRQA